MSGFNVHPEDLKRYARQIGRAHEDVATAIRYVDKSCGMVAVDAGPLSTLAGVAGGGHGEVLDNVNGALRHLAKLLKHSESEIKKAAEHYQETDMAEARKMDATYPDARR